MRQWTHAIGILLVCASTAFAQDAKTTIANASRAIGADGVTSVTMFGAAANYNLGQNNNSQGPWPRTNLNDYRRTIDFAATALRASAQTYGAPPQGTPAVAGQFNQVVAATAPWAAQLEIWVTPWGFLKGAAANNATAATQTVNGRRYTVVTWNAPVKSPGGAAYRVVGYINPTTNLVDRVDTWVENPVFGDLQVENYYSQWRNGAGTFRFPSVIEQKRAGWTSFDAQILGALANPTDLAALMAPPQGGRAGGPPAGGGPGGQPPAVTATSEKLAEGVYRIAGGYNALAVEFADHIVVFEVGPQNEARVQANLAEIRRVIPNKPIRYGIVSHHHFDHTSGLPAVVAEGITLVMHENNKAFFEKALTAPRTLAPDAISKSGKKPVIEGMRDRRVFQDATRTLEILELKGLPHVDGLLMAWLPKEKIIAFADMYNAGPLNAPPNTTFHLATQIMLENLKRMNVDYERVVSVHAPNPDRPITRAEIEAFNPKTN